jgi:hypothetical protein
LAGIIVGGTLDRSVVATARPPERAFSFSDGLSISAGKFMSKLLIALLATFSFAVCTSVSSAETRQLSIHVAAGKHDRINVPVKVPLSLPATLAKGGSVKLLHDGKEIPAQLTQPSLLSKPAAAGDQVAVELVFVLSKLAAGETATLQAELLSLAGTNEGAESFAWNDTAGKYTDLSFAGRPVLRYMYAALDESTPDARHATMKPYHHVYDPQGKLLLTKGPGGLFPHHRGLFFGFNKISYGEEGKQNADTWHCNKGEFTCHQSFASQEAGRVLGRHVANINWFGPKADHFASEQREITAYHLPGGTLIEFADRLSSEVGPVKLDGDPQHAGFQFRASQEVPDKTKAQTYYVRPDGKAQPGKFRNWPSDKGHVNLPWHALSFVIGDQRYTVATIDRPQNPKEARFSERDYGRFGSYFEYDLDTDKPLELNYRVWVQEGEMSVADVQRLADDFVDPVEVTVE